MKKLFAICIFAIGLMISLPSTSSGSTSPPGQVSFVIGHNSVAPAIAIVQDYIFVAYQSQLAPVAIELQEKGGARFENSKTTMLDTFYNCKNAILYLNNSMLKPDYCRLCSAILMPDHIPNHIQAAVLNIHRFARDGLRQG